MAMQGQRLVVNQIQYNTGRHAFHVMNGLRNLIVLVVCPRKSRYATVRRKANWPITKRRSRSQDLNEPKE